jgi:hypothetical protein
LLNRLFGQIHFGLSLYLASHAPTAVDEDFHIHFGKRMSVRRFNSARLFDVGFRWV